jgi:hypothetical protein
MGFNGSDPKRRDERIFQEKKNDYENAEGPVTTQV